MVMFLLVKKKEMIADVIKCFSLKLLLDTESTAL